MATLGVSRTSAAKPLSEYDVKAAFLYNFAKFVQWPPDAFADANSPITIGVLGDDPFGNSLNSVVEGNTVENRKIEVRRYKRISDLKQCHILFVCSSENRNAGKVVDAVKNWSVMTVGEREGFTKSGGTARFFDENNRVRFEINTDNANKANLKISSKLLKLAKVTHN